MPPAQRAVATVSWRPGGVRFAHATCMTAWKTRAALTLCSAVPSIWRRRGVNSSAKHLSLHSSAAGVFTSRPSSSNVRLLLGQKDGCSKLLHNQAQRRVLIGGAKAMHSPRAGSLADAQLSSPPQRSRAPAFAAVLVDVGGTLLETADPVHVTYAAIGAKYGVDVGPDRIKAGFREAFAQPWPERLRYEGDGRKFWRAAVAQATGCADQGYFEELYQHYASGGAWRVAGGAAACLTALRDAGVKLAVVSNFDSRLRPILQDLQVSHLFDAIVVSAEEGYEKPAPEIFQAALGQLGIRDPKQAVHVGDDLAADFEGATAVGLNAWLWKRDVRSFDELLRRVLPGC